MTIFGRPFVKKVRPTLSVRCLSVCLSCLSVTLAYCDQTVGGIQMKLGVQVCLGLATLCYVGTQLPLPQKGQSPQFSAYICCGQMAGWIKMPHGREVGLGPRDIVLHGDPAHPPKKVAKPPPQFSAHLYCVKTAGWIKMALGMEVGLGPATLC